MGRSVWRLARWPTGSAFDAMLNQQQWSACSALSRQIRQEGIYFVAMLSICTDLSVEITLATMCGALRVAPKVPLLLLWSTNNNGQPAPLYHAGSGNKGLVVRSC